MPRTDGNTDAIGDHPGDEHRCKAEGCGRSVDLIAGVTATAHCHGNGFAEIDICDDADCIGDDVDAGLNGEECNDADDPGDPSHPITRHWTGPKPVDRRERSLFPRPHRKYASPE
jgi:hypothetical protein